MQESRGYVPPEARPLQAEQEERLDDKEQTQEEPLPSSLDLVQNFIVWRPTLEAAMKKHGENMNPQKTVEQLVEETVKSVDVNRGIQLTEINRLSGSADAVKKAFAGLEKGIIRALKDKVDGEWNYNQPDMEPGENYFFAGVGAEVEGTEDEAEVAA